MDKVRIMIKSKLYIYISKIQEECAKISYYNQLITQNIKKEPTDILKRVIY
jgi:hypothetical protein